MRHSFSVTAKSSIIQLRDADTRADMPDSMGSARLAATASGVFIGTRMAMDGLTTLVVDTDAHGEPDGDPAFAGLLATPSGRLVILSGHDEVICEFSVPTPQTPVRVWKNHHREPTEIVVFIEPRTRVVR